MRRRLTVLRAGGWTGSQCDQRESPPPSPFARQPTRCTACSLRRAREVSSGLAGTDIPEKVDAMQRVFDPVEAERRRKRDPKAAPRPIDVLLATNMISVGVDVRRLGLMVVAGQPKTTAEYIQATSRVGRSYTGLVCVVYNWARPRDLSHYEQFEHYHATFYQQVEALSVTPISPHPPDRGLAALLTSYVRLSGSEFNKNEAAGEVTATTPYFAQAIKEISQRADEITFN